jgi:membrane protein required for beta-lactamase induction
VKTLLAAFVVGALATWSAGAFAQDSTAQNGAAAYQNPAAAQQTAEEKANVAGSKQQPRAKMPNIKDLTPEQREELKRQLMEQSKP